MTEAVRAGVKYMSWVEKFHRIMANYMPRNLASAAVLRKLGFAVEGVAQAYLLINGRWEDHVLTSLKNEIWRAS